MKTLRFGAVGMYFSAQQWAVAQMMSAWHEISAQNRAKKNFLTPFLAALGFCSHALNRGVDMTTLIIKIDCNEEPTDLDDVVSNVQNTLSEISLSYVVYDVEVREDSQQDILDLLSKTNCLSM